LLIDSTPSPLFTQENFHNPVLSQQTASGRMFTSSFRLSKALLIRTLRPAWLAQSGNMSFHIFRTRTVNCHVTSPSAAIAACASGRKSFEGRTWNGKGTSHERATSNALFTAAGKRRTQSEFKQFNTKQFKISIRMLFLDVEFAADVSCLRCQRAESVNGFRISWTRDKLAVFALSWF